MFSLLGRDKSACHFFEHVDSKSFPQSQIPYKIPQMWYFLFMSEQGPFDGWGAKREEQVERSFSAIESGEIRMEIPCEEARREWFVMARTMYVGNNPEPRFPIDLEVGIHLGRCEATGCQQVSTAYQEILKPSHPGASELLSDIIDTLEASVMPPKDG